MKDLAIPSGSSSFETFVKLPKANSLSSQTAEILREGISEGIWQERLPGERALCEKYQVSRNTVRSALAQLEAEKLIRPEQGSGTRILAPSRRGSRPIKSLDVALLAPEPLARLRPTQALWIDELRALLSERGYRLHVFHGKKYFCHNPGTYLRRMVAENPHGCWILTLSNPAIQRWFSKNKVCCVVAGSVHLGLDLPSRDIDHRAMCRHAAGVLLGLGHLKLALFEAKSQLAGAIEGEAGFLDGVKNSRQAEAEAMVCYHDGSIAGIAAAFRRLMSRVPRPTAMLVGNTYHYLAVVGCLSQMGLRVPQDISLISRDDDLFLAYVVPAPARYAVSAHALAKSLLQLVLDRLENKTPVQRGLRLMPHFIPGESLARIPRA